MKSKDKNKNYNKKKRKSKSKNNKKRKSPEKEESNKKLENTVYFDLDKSNDKELDEDLENQFKQLIVDDSDINLEENEDLNDNEIEKEQEAESSLDIIKDFTDTQPINDRYLMKEPKKDNQYYYGNQNLNNKTNPFIKELNKVNNNEIDTIKEI